MATAEWLSNHPEKRKEYSARYYQKHKDRCKEADKKWKAKNIEKVRQWCRNYRNSDLNRARDRWRKWRTDNPGKDLARVRLREARKLQATPLWLSSDDIAKMKDIYSEARRKKLVVDHIVPLRGTNVRGLHVPWNLQLLTKEENARKGNRL